MTVPSRFPMRFRNAGRTLLVVGMVLALAGCATSKDELMPLESDATMKELWQQGGADGAADDLSQQGLLDGRSNLRRPLGSGAMVDQRVRYTRNAANEIYSQFSRLPNPDIVMYVYPHLAGAGEAVPVPGYSTVFSLYTAPQYAMPGEKARPSVDEAQRTRRTR